MSVHFSYWQGVVAIFGAVILREARPSAHLRVDALTRVLRATDDP